ncbi:copper resistance D family protein [Paenibacillus sp. L3-i20]|uniref:copper resistance D family protein n=1 Tax=Paenibacillus sp. L3-i20 TaxID=2905833 RepID=UPI001EDF4E4F|nr:CopD family protein [Paenibacillus sp. L3-i20]GKU78889.1 hypothetical protein L3i20_v232860 [Paenibacillus sp. L3-i20]
MYFYLFETLLYLSLAFTGGYIFLLFIPERSKPQIKVPIDVFQYALLGIPLFSFATILRTVFSLTDFAENLTFLELLLIVLKDYDFGNAWVWNLIICTAMFIVTMVSSARANWFKWALALTWCLSIIAHGWASHPASFSNIGLLSQSVHVAAISIWLGILIIVAWFTKGEWNWKAFVRWFTPVSIGSMILITLAGISMMFIIVDNYINSWGINYGQALLLKHLVFLPMLLLAFMNGFMTKLTNDGRNEPRLQWWLRAETVIALIILIITAFMGVQEPPHEGEFEDPSPSALFLFLNGSVSDLSLQWHWNLPSVACILLGIISVGLLMMSYKQENRKLFILLTCIIIVFLFFGLLLAVQ